jgi:hypothetical protein
MGFAQVFVHWLLNIAGNLKTNAINFRILAGKFGVLNRFRLFYNRFYRIAHTFVYHGSNFDKGNYIPFLNKMRT